MKNKLKIIDISDPVDNIKITCNECQIECYPTLALWGKDCKPDICDECVQKGWIPVEYLEARRLLGLKENQKLNEKIYRLSPFYKLHNEN